MLVVRPLLFGVALLAASAPALLAADPPGKKPEEPTVVSYYRHVRPLFQQHCQGCHQPAKAEGGYLMTAYDELFKKGESDQPGVVAGRPEKSHIVQQITPHDGKAPQMPRGKE